MSAGNPQVLAPGDEVRFDGAMHTVVGVSAKLVRLVDPAGTPSVVAVGHLLRDPSFAVVRAGSPRAPLPPLGLLEELPDAVIERAHWWHRHVVEVLTGLPPDADPGTAPRPEYRLETSLHQRELAKLAELRAAGHQVGESTLRKMRIRFTRQGMWGLVDQGAVRSLRPPNTRSDARVVEAVRHAVVGETNRSSGTVGRLRRRVEQDLAAEHGAGVVPMPSERTFYRLVAQLTQGRHTFGSARTRRSLAKQPDGPFGHVTAHRPGELMQIDSTPLDVRAVLDDGLVDRVELTALVDQATRTIAAAVLRPSTKAVDAALLLARAVTPEPMRPGWAEALRLTRSVLPHRALVDLDSRLEHAAAKPVILPETIVCDHGKAYLSNAFREGCRALGINFQPAHPDTPTDKPVIERTLESVGTLFAQHVAGYVGSCVERRGRNAEDQAVWSLLELQDLLDEWVVAAWQNRRHDGLRDPTMPGTALSPNEKYAALLGVAGYVPVPLSAEDYIELLPSTWRAINSYGIKLHHRTYDAKALNPYRRQHSGIDTRKGLWEVHHDPYDVSRVWVRNHHDGGWITATWTQLDLAPAPFGELIWDHTRQVLDQRGSDPATEAEIATAASELLNRADAGPQPTRDTAEHRRERRVVGRTKATTKPTWPRPDPDGSGGPAPQPDDQPQSTDTDSSGLAEVIPLGVFDAREEAKKWW